MSRADSDTPGPERHAERQRDAADLSPNEQTVLSQQTAPNRTPADQRRAIDAEQEVAPGNAPDPLDDHDDQTGGGAGTER
jgi:hypothetical protein